MHRLAKFFIKHNISGAPVIASDHELVGVVTVSDIFKFSNMDERNRREALCNYYREACEIELRAIFPLNYLIRILVDQASG